MKNDAVLTLSVQKDQGFSFWSFVRAPNHVFAGCNRQGLCHQMAWKP